jgi:hypothetical protein
VAPSPSSLLPCSAPHARQLCTACLDRLWAGAGCPHLLPFLTSDPLPFALPLSLGCKKNHRAPAPPRHLFFPTRARRGVIDCRKDLTAVAHRLLGPPPSPPRFQTEMRRPRPHKVARRIPCNPLVLDSPPPQNIGARSAAGDSATVVAQRVVTASIARPRRTKRAGRLDRFLQLGWAD